MNGNLIGTVSALFGLFAFGVLFNHLITWAKRYGWLEPYTALFVAFGVTITIFGMTVIDYLVDWNAGLIALVCFIASGLPMILGDAARYVSAMRREIEGHRDDES